MPVSLYPTISFVGHLGQLSIRSLAHPHRRPCPSASSISTIRHRRRPPPSVIAAGHSRQPLRARSPSLRAPSWPPRVTSFSEPQSPRYASKSCCISSIALASPIHQFRSSLAGPHRRPWPSASSVGAPIGHRRRPHPSAIAVGHLRRPPPPISATAFRRVPRPCCPVNHLCFLSLRVPF